MLAKQTLRLITYLAINWMGAFRWYCNTGPTRDGDEEVPTFSKNQFNILILRSDKNRRYTS
jgi:hypothetical protein